MNSNKDFYSVTYQNDALHSYMMFKLKSDDKLIDYQIKIIKDNPVQNLLSLHRKQFDDEVFIHYDITSKITMEQFLIRKKLSRFEFLTIIKSLIKGLQMGKQYLLHGGRYILDYKYIYINPSSLEVALAYMPIETQVDIKEELRAFLMDLIVYKITFMNQEEGSFVYRLLNLLKGETFSLEQLDKLVFSIAVECGATKADTMNEAKSKELASADGNESIIKDEKNGARKPARRDSLVKGKLYIMLLVQLLFIALTFLIVRLLNKQNQDLDIYTVAGVILLILSIDFLVIKKLGIGNRHKVNNLKNEIDINVVKDSGSLARKNNRNNKLQTIYPAMTSNPRINLFSDMETTVLSDQAASYAYLLSCQDNMNDRIILDKASFIIGRVKNQVDYISRNNAVGKVHAEITNRDNIYYLKDLNSRNGTYINGERIVSNVEYIIKNNDRVTFANSEYKFMRADGAN